MRALICSVAIISLSIASTCIANTDDNNVINLRIISADHSYTLSHISYGGPDCPLADNGTLPEKISLQPGAPAQLLGEIALPLNRSCQIVYRDSSPAKPDLIINIRTFNWGGDPSESIHYIDGQNPKDGVTLNGTEYPVVAYSNGGRLR